MGVGGVESVNASALPPGLFPERDALVITNLHDNIELSGNIGLVAPDVMAGNQYAVARDDLTGLEKGDVTNEQVLDVDDAFVSGADNLDATFLPPVIEDAELLFLL